MKGWNVLVIFRSVSSLQFSLIIDEGIHFNKIKWRKIYMCWGHGMIIDLSSKFVRCVKRNTSSSLFLLLKRVILVLSIQWCTLAWNRYLNAFYSNNLAIYISINASFFMICNVKYGFRLKMATCLTQLSTLLFVWFQGHISMSDYH